MKFNKSKLSLNGGCAYCTKNCQFNGLSVDAASDKAAKKDSFGMLINPANSVKYGCNNSR